MQPLDRKYILQLLFDHRKQLASFGVEQIGLFGSFARDEATEDSDVDLLVDLQQDKKKFRNFMSLNYYLEELMGRKVELVTRQSLSPYIGPHILKSVEYVSIGN